MKCDKKDLLLYAVTDRSWLNGETLYSQVEKALEGGATFVQLREKHLDHDAFLQEAKEIKELCAKYQVPFVLDDDVELALEVGADGVHVGQSDMEAGDVRAKLGEDKIVGVSAQTVEQALLAQERGADYLGVGAVFPTSSKDDAVEVDHEMVKAICEAVDIPVIAIGGITKDNVQELSGCGLCGIAVISAIFAKPDIKKATEELKAACEKISEAGYKPFTTGFSEWWVFKHVWQHFLAAAAGDAGVEVSDLVASFEKGEAKVADYPALYNNFFDFIDLAVQYGDDKPLETALENELAAFGSGEAAMVLGQGAWIEADSLAIDPNLQIGFNGYPVSDKADQCKIISGSDQALHVYNESEALQATLDFVNWWYTSDYGINWFTDVAGVVPPVQTEGESSFEIIKQGSELEASEGSAALGICYSTDSWHQVFGELIQSYITGSADKDATCAAIEEQWAAIDGAE